MCIVDISFNVNPLWHILGKTPQKRLQNIITQVAENYHITTHKAHRCDVCAFQCFHFQHT